MEPESIQLTIEGEPGEKLTVRYRGNREEDDPSPIVYEGAIGSDGRLTVAVPRAYLVILSRHGTMPLMLHEEPGTQKTIRLTGAE